MSEEKAVVIESPYGNGRVIVTQDIEAKHGASIKIEGNDVFYASAGYSVCTGTENHDYIDNDEEHSELIRTWERDTVDIKCDKTEVLTDSDWDVAYESKPKDLITKNL